MNEFSFETAFRALTGHTPMKWQARLFRQFAEGKLPNALSLETGLGKTSVMAIWLIALAHQAAEGEVKLPRRLVYVVNRRTIVDQATEEAEKLREKLTATDASEVVIRLRDALSKLCIDPADNASPLAISTLRGERADNREWQADPSRPAIIVGTVDMIGSRLLFSSYGAGWKMRAFNAGLIGHDTLIVHDETHLTPAFDALLREIECRQRGQERGLRLLSLSATQRFLASSSKKDRSERTVFCLTDEDRGEDIVKRRINAAKALYFQDVAEAKLLPQKLAEAALAHRDGKCRVLLYVRTPEDAAKTHDILVKYLDEKADVGLLTGTLRGHERDDLAKSTFFKSFLAGAKEPLERSRFLVATSAGEVGINLDADHLVCDLTTLESMIQRFGRVNRLGRDDEAFIARVDICDVRADKKDEQQRRMTRRLLASLTKTEDGGHIASPAALGGVANSTEAQKAFSEPPRERALTDILLDKWALTSVREALPGRPPVDDWLHGIEADLPETVIAWREEVSDLARACVASSDVDDWFDAHPIKPWERLREPSYRAADQFKKMAARLEKAAGYTEGEPRAIVITQNELKIVSISDLADKDLIKNAQVILPLEAGGLSKGMLDGASDEASDVADMRYEGMPRRAHIRLSRTEDSGWNVERLGIESDESEFSDQSKLQNAADELGSFAPPDDVVRAIARSVGLKEKERVVLLDDEGEIAHVLIAFGESKDAETALEASAVAREDQTLDDHLEWTGITAKLIVSRLSLDHRIADAVVLAGQGHDRGKKREPWQRAIGNAPPKKALAKTGHGRFDIRLCAGYRHEFGSLIDVAKDEDIARYPERDLILHLIACHHGRARPHFEEREYDPDASDELNAKTAAEAMRRYARLSRRFGPWQLAWLEALMKCADVIATKKGADVEGLK